MDRRKPEPKTIDIIAEYHRKKPLEDKIYPEHLRTYTNPNNGKQAAYEIGRNGREDEQQE